MRPLSAWPRWAEALLVGLVALAGAAFACRWALRVDNWRVMTDELLYVKLAEHAADHLQLRPEFRGTLVANYSVLYSYLLAPLFALFDFAAAFRLAHALNALLLASTAVPAYLLARDACRSRAAGLAAAVPVAFTPWLLLSLNLMTEPLAEPLLVWTVWAFARTVAEPRLWRDILALALALALTITRAQFIFMVPLLPAAVVLHELGMGLSGRSPRVWLGQAWRGLKAAVTGHPLLAVVTVVGVVLLTEVTSTASLVGDYGVVVSTSLIPPGFTEAAVSHLALVAFGVGVVPLALTVAFVVDALWRPPDRQTHAAAVCLLLVVPALTFVATSFDLRFSSVLQERYLFYAGPLLLAGAVCFVATARRPLPTAAFGAVAGGVLVATAQGLAPVGDTGVFASPARQAWVPLDYYVGRVFSVVGMADVSRVYVLAGAAAVAALIVAALIATRRRRVALIVLGAGLAVWCAALTNYAGPRVFLEHERLARIGLDGNLPLGQRSWIDATVGKEADVGIAPSPISGRDGRPTPAQGVGDYSVWWEAEFWNDAVGSSYVLTGARDFTPYAQHQMTIDRRTGRLHVTGRQARYLAVARSTFLYGLVGADVTHRRDVELIRPVHPYRAAWASFGVGNAGRLPSHKRADIQVYGPATGRPRRVEVSLRVVGRTLERPLTIRGGGAPDALRLSGARTLRREVCVPTHRARTVRLTVGGRNRLRLIAVRVRMGGPC